ncbi:hypothetical protein BN130_4222 [Cronobacter malonaticus 507]|nr:hypothetical protein BN130_4222 [Cronobacter malonaticus 507]
MHLVASCGKVSLSAPFPDNSMKKIIVGISGASGAIMPYY